MTTEEIELLQDLKDYMSSRSALIDVGEDEFGVFWQCENEEMCFDKRIDAVLRSATAQTKAEVFEVMFDTTQNTE